MSYGNHIDFSKVKKALIIKLRHHGDVLLSSPVFSTLKNYYPHLDLHALVYKDTQPMLEGHPSINKFFCYDKKWKEGSKFSKLKKEIDLYKKLRAEKYDLILNLTEGDRGALIALFSKASFKVGFDPGKAGFLGKKKVYTHIIKKVNGQRHAVERDLDAIRRIGVFPEIQDKELYLEIPEEAKAKVATLLQDEGIEAKRLLIVHPVSRWRFKCPPAAWFVKLIQELEKRNYQIVLTASSDPVEMEMVNTILKKLSFTRAVSFAGKTSLKELAALINTAACLITVDSVPLHIASALKAKSIALFGPSSEINWGPWSNPQGFVVAEKLPCRPCFLDGCGGSKISECLTDIPLEKVLSLL